MGSFGKNLQHLSDKMKSSLRTKLCEVKLIIIDEISMFSNLLLYHIRLRLVEIFCCSDNQPLAGLSAIAVGDLYQLPPVGGKPVYAECNNYWESSEAVWKHFQIHELTEVMHKHGNSQRIDLWNQVRIGKLDRHNITLLE